MNNFPKLSQSPYTFKYVPTLPTFKSALETSLFSCTFISLISYLCVLLEVLIFHFTPFWLIKFFSWSVFQFYGIFFPLCYSHTKNPVQILKLVHVPACTPGNQPDIVFFFFYLSCRTYISQKTLNSELCTKGQFQLGLFFAPFLYTVY